MKLCLMIFISSDSHIFEFQNGLVEKTYYKLRVSNLNKFYGENLSLQRVNQA